MEKGNGMRRMWRMEIGMQKIGVEMLGIGVGMQKIEVGMR